MKIKNPLIKNFKKVTAPKNKNLKFAIIAGLATMFVVAPAVGVATEYQVFDPDIVKAKDMSAIANTLDADTTYMGSEYRFIPPEDKPIYFNVDIEGMTDNDKRAIADAVELLDMVCHDINPNYNLEVRFNPTKSQLNDNYTVKVIKDDIKGTATGLSSVDRYFFTTSGKGTYKSTITLDYTLFGQEDNYYILKNTTLHEAVHSIARFDDAYDIEGYDTPTVMQSSNSSEIPFTLNDIKILQSKLSETPRLTMSAEEIFKKTLPLEDMQAKIDYVTSTITSDYLNEYFKLEGDDKITDDVQFDNIESMYAISQDNTTWGATVNGQHALKSGSVVNLYNFSDDMFQYGRFNYDIEKSELLSSAFKKVDMDGKIYMDYNQIPAKWGNNLLIINAVPANNETGWNLSVAKAPIVSEEKYNEVYSRLQANVNTDYFNSKIAEEIRPDNFSSIEEGSTLAFQSPIGTQVYRNGLFYIDDSKPYATEISDGILLTGANYAITKDTHDNYKLMVYSYDLIEDDVNISATINLKDMIHSSERGM